MSKIALANEEVIKKFKKVVNQESINDEYVVLSKEEPIIVMNDKVEVKESSEYELFIKDMNDLFDEIQMQRQSELYNYYANFIIRYPGISFIDYLIDYSENKDKSKIIDFENKKQKALQKVYKEYVERGQSTDDPDYFKYYCENHSNIIDDLGGYGYIIQEYDVDEFISNMTHCELENEIVFC